METSSPAAAARPKTSGTTSGPMTLPTIPLSTHELRVRWTQADDHSLNRILGYFRLNTPNCEVNEFIIPIELDADHNTVPPLDRWNGLVVPWDHDLSPLKCIMFLVCDRILYDQIRAYAIRAMDGLLDLRCGSSQRSAGYTAKMILALTPPADLIYRVGTLATEAEHLAAQVNDLRDEIRHLKLQVGMRDLRLHQLRDTLGIVVESLCAMDPSLIPLFPGLSVPPGQLVDPVDAPEPDA